MPEPSTSATFGPACLTASLNTSSSDMAVSPGRRATGGPGQGGLPGAGGHAYQLDTTVLPQRPGVERHVVGVGLGRVAVQTRAKELGPAGVADIDPLPGLLTRQPQPLAQVG